MQTTTTAAETTSIHPLAGLMSAESLASEVEGAGELFASFRPADEIEVTRLTGRYGTVRGRFLAARIARAIRRTQDPCISHLRACRTDKPDEVAGYEEIRSDGCCGSEDFEETFTPAWDPSAPAEIYRLGFNYGH